MALKLALEFSRIVNLFRESNIDTPRIRVGMEVGPVIAGIVGKKKFAYDCMLSFHSCMLHLLTLNQLGWFEAVNEAAKLEVNGMEDMCT